MAYKVISPFADSQDKTKAFPNGRIYAVGDSFPAAKRKISDDRIKQLISSANAIGRAVIKEVGDK
ncbi:MAG: hypothetical protein AB7E42_03260 [Anaerotignaceae bacterium]